MYQNCFRCEYKQLQHHRDRYRHHQPTTKQNNVHVGSSLNPTFHSSTSIAHEAKEEPCAPLASDLTTTVLPVFRLKGIGAKPE